MWDNFIIPASRPPAPPASGGTTRYRGKRALPSDQRQNNSLELGIGFMRIIRHPAAQERFYVSKIIIQRHLFVHIRRELLRRWNIATPESHVFAPYPHNRGRVNVRLS